MQGWYPFTLATNTGLSMQGSCNDAVVGAADPLRALHKQQNDQSRTSAALPPAISVGHLQRAEGMKIYSEYMFIPSAEGFLVLGHARLFLHLLYLCLAILRAGQGQQVSAGLPQDTGLAKRGCLSENTPQWSTGTCLSGCPTSCMPCSVSHGETTVPEESFRFALRS